MIAAYKKGGNVMGKEKDFVLIQTAPGNHGSLDAYSAESEDAFFYKFEYVQPYEKFCGIPDYQIKERAVNVFGESITVFIDLTDWLGHEEEYYFYVITAFLADNRKDGRYIFYAETENAGEFKGLYRSLRKTMNGDMKEFAFTDTEDEIKSTVKRTGRYDREAVDALTNVIKLSVFNDFRSEEMLDRIADEAAESENTFVTLEQLISYAEDTENSLFGVFGRGKEFREELMKIKEAKGNAKI